MVAAGGTVHRRVVLQAVAGVLLILLGASAILWLVFDDRLPTTTPTLGGTSLTLWAVVRVAGAIALSAGTWLLALAQMDRRRHRSR